MPLRSLLDAFAFSSLLAAAIAFALCGVVCAVLDTPRTVHWAGLAASGTFIVYNLDRLRDTARDRTTSPARTDFVEKHRTLLIACTIASSGVFIVLLGSSPTDVALTTAAIGAIGLLHRRIKRVAALKAAYVSLAWAAICVGIPWLAAGRPAAGVWVAAGVIPVLAANLVASNLRDDETQWFEGQPSRALIVAGLLAVLGVGAALLAASRASSLAWIGAAEGLAILGFRPGERYGLIMIDGALLVGAGLAWLQLRALG